MNYESLAALIDGEMPISALSAEIFRLQDENQRLRDALEIIEHTLATLRGGK